MKKNIGDIVERVMGKEERSLCFLSLYGFQSFFHRVFRKPMQKRNKKKPHKKQQRQGCVLLLKDARQKLWRPYSCYHF